MAKITAIELENFQSIGKRTLIPIRDLTLMFGPNGAGKSSLFDALHLLKIIVSDDWGYDNQKLTELLHRWSRNITTKNPSNEIGVGIQIFIDDSWSWDELRDFDTFNRLGRVAVSSIDKNSDYGETFLNKNYYFFIKFQNFSCSIYDWAISELTISSENNKILEIKQNELKNYPTGYLELLSI